MIDIVIIDEEFNFAENVASIFRIEGYKTIVLTDATEALLHFQGSGLGVRDIVMLVDVSLAPGENEELFSPSSTNEYMETGIVLVDELAKRGFIPNSPQRIVLYTAHYTTELWDVISACCDQNHYTRWQKRATADPQELVDLVGRCIA